MIEYIIKNITLETPIHTLIILCFLYSVYYYIQWRKNRRPKMLSIKYINHEHSRRLLFTITSNNPNGSEILNKPIKVKILSKNIFKQNVTIFLTFTTHEFYLNSKLHLDIIPNWLIQKQESFVAELSDNQLTQDGTYKITAYTSDGRCSNTIQINSDFNLIHDEAHQDNKLKKSVRILQNEPDKEHIISN